MSTTKQFLRLPDVIKMVGKSRTAIYRDIQGGTFPAPIRIGARAVAWNSVDVENWQQARIDAAAAGPAAKAGSQG